MGGIANGILTLHNTYHIPDTISYCISKGVFLLDTKDIINIPITINTARQIKKGFLTLNLFNDDDKNSTIIGFVINNIKHINPDLDLEDIYNRLLNYRSGLLFLTGIDYDGIEKTFYNFIITRMVSFETRVDEIGRMHDSIYGSVEILSIPGTNIMHCW